MKKSLSILFVLSCVTMLRAQPPTYDDLLILLADENYPKLIKESTKYSEKDDTKNDPVVYYYLAQGYYRISFVSDRDEEYKNAYKQVFSVLGKCFKKDKDSTVYEKYNDFFAEVRQSLVEAVENDLEAGDYRKAGGWVRKGYKMNRYDVGGFYLEGACKYMVADKGGAKALWKEADKLLENVKSLDDYFPADKKMLKLGVFMTAECYIKMKQPDKAKALLGKVAQWYENDSDFKQRYDEIVN
ncbi:MAG: tetratricopeptide repeat protein [Bacteroidetes bacterium]|nr:MAG: tetratricopeptide repeat protein [Bacteroidota bacterium]